MQAAKMDHDLGLDERPDDDAFDDILLHVDGWLCEIKDVQIRDGLHVLGQAPAGEAEVDLVLAILRARQMWGGEQSRAGPARRRWAWPRTAPTTAAAVDAVEAAGPRAGRRAAEDRAGIAERRRRDSPTTPTSRRCCGSPPPRWCRGWPARPTRSTQVLHALDGGFIAGGPVRLAAARPGQRAADRPQLLLRRPEGGAVAAGLGDRSGDGRLAAGRATATTTASCPQSVGLSVWGTVGDAHLRRRHRRGACAARRSPGVGRGLAPRRRPRADPARRARPPPHRRHRAHLRLLPRRVPARGRDARRRRAAGRRASTSPPRRTTSAPTPRPTSPSTATSAAPPPGSSAPSPGTYGAGLLQLIDSRNWRDDADLAEVYTAWGGFAYGRGLDGAPAADDMNGSTGGSRWRPRTPTPASTTSPTPTTTSSTTAA